MAKNPSVMLHHHSKRRVLITGATGFIGCRLAQRLSVDSQYQVNALVHTWSGPGLARLGCLPVNIVRGDLLDQQSLHHVVDGCDVVVHCAFGNRGHAQHRTDVTVDGTRNLLRASVDAQVDKFIHLSTAVVHGRGPKCQIVNESSTFRNDGDLYSKMKSQAEMQVWHDYHNDGLPVVVFRPGIVYGPYSAWTSRILNELTSGIYLINGGRGIANVIYIDNLVDALMLAIDSPKAIGQAFLATDDELITWRQFYDAHAAILTSRALMQDLPLSVWRRQQRKQYLYDWMRKFGLPLRICSVATEQATQVAVRELKTEIYQRPWLRALVDKVPSVVKNRLKKLVRDHRHSIDRSDHEPNNLPNKFPDRIQVKLHTCSARYSNKRMKQVLKWEQRIPLNEAMDFIGEWRACQRLAA